MRAEENTAAHHQHNDHKIIDIPAEALDQFIADKSAGYAAEHYQYPVCADLSAEHSKKRKHKKPLKNPLYKTIQPANG